MLQKHYLHHMQYLASFIIWRRKTIRASQCYISSIQSVHAPWTYNARLCRKDFQLTYFQKEGSPWFVANKYRDIILVMKTDCVVMNVEYRCYNIFHTLNNGTSKSIIWCEQDARIIYKIYVRSMFKILLQN